MLLFIATCHATIYSTWHVMQKMEASQRANGKDCVLIFDTSSYAIFSTYLPREGPYNEYI